MLKDNIDKEKKKLNEMIDKLNSIYDDEVGD